MTIGAAGWEKRAEARDRVLGVLFLVGEGVPISEVAEIEGVSRARVYQ